MKGIGNDIIEIERIALSIKKHKERFLNRLFTKREREYCENYAHPAPHFAGRFAAKEAVAKALSTGIGAALCWLDMEILRESQGNPIVHFSEKALQEFNQPKVLLSISHCHLYASAVALWVE